MVLSEAEGFLKMARADLATALESSDPARFREARSQDLARLLHYAVQFRYEFNLPPPALDRAEWNEKVKEFSILWLFIWQVEPAADPWQGSNGWSRRPWRRCRRQRGSTGHFEAPYKKGTHRKPGKSFSCANLFIDLWGMVFFWGGGGILTASSHPCAVVIPLRTIAKHCKRFTLLLAAPAALLLSQEQAKAVLTYNFFESAGNVIVQTSGRLNLTGATPLGPDVGCGPAAFDSDVAVLCTGLKNNYDEYVISGPSAFDGNGNLQFASSVSGINIIIIGVANTFAIDSTYVSTTPIVSSATFNNQTLTSLGFTATGLIGTWSLTGTSETIQMFVGNPPAAAVPGPRSLFGAGAAFGWSRRLRKRIATPLITPPQA